jgi:hypothetical protein
MATRILLLVTSVSLLLTARLGPGVDKALANHADGNMPWSVNYWIVEDQIRVCNQSVRAPDP